MRWFTHGIRITILIIVIGLWSLSEATIYLSTLMVKAVVYWRFSVYAPQNIHSLHSQHWTRVDPYMMHISIAGICVLGGQSHAVIMWLQIISKKYLKKYLAVLVVLRTDAFCRVPYGGVSHVLMYFIWEPVSVLGTVVSFISSCTKFMLKIKALII